MNFSLTQILTAMVMVGVGIALVFAYRKYLAASSERRMRAMLVSVGVDPEIASIGAIETIMTGVRQRCRACTSADVCERWLDGEIQGDNDFCPNAKVFEVFRRYRGAT
ncbi:MAG: DUF6455 family protein [Gammaproteobacteria bacterium]|nr:DUF6455 family protein [Gammaproteobacteria bacterium]